MDYRNLGRTGLKVSAITLGCMSFGDGQGNQRWSLPEEQSREIIKQALDAGITTWDTANVYSAGRSEEIVGRALKDFAAREDIVLATKVFFPTREGVYGGGLSRKAVLAEIDNSLRRLGVDHVDLYQIHRWDPETPIEETMEALHDVVRAGKARYLGASSMWTWQFQQAQHVAERHGWTPFVSMQDHYNLLYREEEREMFPYCAETGVGILPWSPLARGKLTRPWDASTARTETDEPGRRLYRDSDRSVVEAVSKVAADRGVALAQVALAWMLRNPAVTSPIIGATKQAHLADAIAATEVELSDDEVAALEAPYEPHAVSGHQ